MQALEARGNDVLLRVRVQPKASRNALHLLEDGRIRVTLTAPPVDGAANKALCAFMAKRIGCPRHQVSVIRGEKSRDKTLQFEGHRIADVSAVLESA